MHVEYHHFSECLSYIYGTHQIIFCVQKGLVCFQRQAFEVVPGCDSEHLSAYSADFCVNASYLMNAIDNVTSLDSSSEAPMEDADVELEEELEDGAWENDIGWDGTAVDNTISPVAAAIGAPDNTPAPTVIPTAAPSIADSMDSTASETITQEPSASAVELPVLKIIGNAGIYDTYPLQECQGSCVSDADCRDGLICLFRYGLGEGPVQGCSGIAHEGANYCIAELDGAHESYDDSPNSSAPSSDSTETSNPTDGASEMSLSTLAATIATTETYAPSSDLNATIEAVQLDPSVSSASLPPLTLVFESLDHLPECAGGKFKLQYVDNPGSS